MRLASCLSLAVFLVTAASDARAALLRGTAEAVVEAGDWRDQFGNGVVPFDLDPGSLVGVHASIRFWIDTDSLPPDLNADPLHSTYFTPGFDPEWVVMEIEMNGHTRRMGPGQRLVDTFEASGPGNYGDFLQVASDRQALLPDGSPYYPESLQLWVNVDDFGQGGPIPTDLDLTAFRPIRNGNVYSLQEIGLDPNGAPTVSTSLYLDFDLLSVSMHPVPEPSALALLAIGALPLLGRSAGVTSGRRR